MEKTIVIRKKQQAGLSLIQISRQGKSSSVHRCPVHEIFDILFYTNVDTVLTHREQDGGAVRLAAALRETDCFRDTLLDDSGTVPGSRLMQNDTGDVYQVVGSLVSEIKERLHRDGIYRRMPVLQLAIQRNGKTTTLLARERSSLLQAAEHILGNRLSAPFFQEHCPGSYGILADWQRQARVRAVVLMEQLAVNLDREQGDYALLRGVDRFQIVRPGLDSDGCWVQYDMFPVESIVQLFLSLGTVPRPPAERLACLYYLETIGRLQTLLETSRGIDLAGLRKHCRDLFPALAREVDVEEMHVVLGMPVATLLLFLVNWDALFSNRKIVSRLKQSSCTFSGYLAMDSCHGLEEQFELFDALYPDEFSSLLSGFGRVGTKNGRMQELSVMVRRTTRRINDDYTWTPGMVEERFGLKRLWRGKWVTNGEWIVAVELIGESLADLDGVLGRKLFQWLSGNFPLQLAYGARGHGKAAAHYKREETHTINLTRFRGAGCLAHEFGHYLDWCLGSVYGKQVPDMKQDAPVLLSSSIMQGWVSRLSAAADLFHGLTRKRVSSGSVTSVVTDKPDQVGVTFEVTTDFYRNAQGMTPYWSQPTELFARAFECWVEDGLASNGVRSPGLVADTSHPTVYPQAEERQRINSLMTRMLETVTGNFTDVLAVRTPGGISR